MERLLALLKDMDAGSPEHLILKGMVFDQAQTLDYQQRAPARRFERAFSWATRAIGNLLLIAAYILAVIVLQPWLSGEKNWSTAAWDEVLPCVKLAALGGLLLFGSLFLLSDVEKGRKKWLKEQSPLVPAGALKEPGPNDGAGQGELTGGGVRAVTGDATANGSPPVGHGETPGA